MKTDLPQANQKATPQVNQQPASDLASDLASQPVESLRPHADKPVMRQPTRRLASIMFTDMVGYSTLVHRNEALGLELLNEHRTIVRAAIHVHHGREIDTAGDGFVVEFSSTLDSVRCAVQIQESFAARNLNSPPERAVKLRIGIHTSDVVPSSSDGKHSIYGDGVNIAARLQPLAPQGGICISSTVFEQINGRIDCPMNFMGEGRLKGIDSPIRLYSIDLNTPGFVRRVRRRLRYFPPIRRLAMGAASFLAIASLMAVVLVLKPQLLNKFVSPDAPSAPSAPFNGGERIAILPFEGTGLSDEDSFLPDGIMNGLISTLSQKGLRILAKNSVIELHKAHRRPKQIGTELNIGRVVMGTIRKRHDGAKEIHYSIGVSIVNTNNEEVEWTKDYSAKVESLVELQNSIAKDLRERLAVFPTGPNVASKSTPKNEAYLAYMRGQFFLSKRTTDDFLKAAKEFDNAIEIDPNFAAAFAALSKVNNLQAWYGFIAPAKSELSSIRYATHALVLDPNNTDALISLAETTAYTQYNFAEAEKLYLRGIAANPQDPTAHQWYAELLSFLGRFTEAEQQIHLAIEIDPLNLVTTTAAGVVSYYGRNFDRAIEQLLAVRNLDSNFMLVNYWLGQAYLAKGDFSNAVVSLGKALDLGKDAMTVKAALAHAYAKAGQKERASALMSELESSTNERYVSPLYFAIIHLGLGNEQETLRLLKKAVDQRASQTVTVLQDPRFDEIRSHPEFKSILKTLRPAR
jgi:class 3 adenylate cyclase/TolB-like protein/Tfp pilus assembly protein PilF